jgi:hypothetical protein
MNGVLLKPSSTKLDTNKLKSRVFWKVLAKNNISSLHTGTSNAGITSPQMNIAFGKCDQVKTQKLKSLYQLGRVA